MFFIAQNAEAPTSKAKKKKQRKTSGCIIGIIAKPAVARSKF